MHKFFYNNITSKCTYRSNPIILELIFIKMWDRILQELFFVWKYSNSLNTPIYSLMKSVKFYIISFIPQFHKRQTFLERTFLFIRNRASLLKGIYYIIYRTHQTNKIFHRELRGPLFILVHPPILQRPRKRRGVGVLHQMQPIRRA